MSPAFERGDILFLTMHKKDPIIAGDIAVFKIKGREIPIVHRVLKVHQERKSSKLYVLTKGDNNNVHDRGLYNKDQLWLHSEDIVGRVRGYLPYLGMITIIMNDYPKLKILLIGIMGAFVMFNRE